MSTARATLDALEPTLEYIRQKFGKKPPKPEAGGDEHEKEATPKTT